MQGAHGSCNSKAADARIIGNCVISFGVATSEQVKWHYEKSCPQIVSKQAPYLRLGCRLHFIDGRHGVCNMDADY